MKPWQFLACWLLGTAAMATAAARYVLWRQETQAPSATAGKSGKSRDSEELFHEWVHSNLQLTPEQHAALSTRELAYESHRRELRAGMTAASRALAETIRSAPEFSGDVKDALTRLSAVQSDLQRATLEHFFEMKHSLSPAQQDKLLFWTHDSLLSH